MEKSKNATMYTTREAAIRLGYSMENVYRLVIFGKLIPEKIYGRNLFTEEELTRFEELRDCKRNLKAKNHEQE